MSNEAKKFKLTPAMAILLAGVMISATLIGLKFVPTNTKTPSGDSGAVPVRLIQKNDYVYGSKDAQIILFEYSDLQCPYCDLFHPTVKKLVDDSAGKVALVYRYLPLESIHPEARPSAHAAECVGEELGNDSFWKFVETMFDNQKSLGASFYKETALSLGAKSDTFTACLADTTKNDIIDTDLAEAVAAGGQGTPYTIAVNIKTGAWRPLSGSVPAASLQAVINTIK